MTLHVETPEGVCPWGCPSCRPTRWSRIRSWLAPKGMMPSLDEWLHAITCTVLTIGGISLAVCVALIIVSAIRWLMVGQ